MSAEILARECRSLVQRLRLWTPARFAAAAPGGVRADVVRHLAQVLADTAAGLEDEPRRTLPVLDSDLGLADQLAVTADDARRAGPSPEEARSLIAHVLLHRHDLLGDDVPAGLAASIGCAGGADVLATGAAVCSLSR